MPMRPRRSSGKHTALRIQPGVLPAWLDGVRERLAAADFFERPSLVAVELERVHRDVEMAVEDQIRRSRWDIHGAGKSGMKIVRDSLRECAAAHAQNRVEQP